MTLNPLDQGSCPMSTSREQRVGHAWTAPVLAIVLLAVEAVIVAESWRGLTGFAHLIGIDGHAAWGVPVTLDGVSLVAALTALRAELAGESSGVYRATLFAFTAGSAAANWWHGEHQGGTQAALYLGGMSIAVAVVFALALRQIRHEDRRRAGTVTARLPRFSAAHWLRFPRLTWQAWSLAVRDGHASPRTALDAALGRTPATGPVALTTSQPKALASGRHEQSRARARGRQARGTVSAEDTEREFFAELASGAVPSIRQVRSRMHVGQPKAVELHEHLTRVATTNGTASEFTAT
jgi:Protein of unknown function (DUF2637)